MRFRVVLILLGCIGVSAPASIAHVSRAHARTIDPSYSSALAAANRFLYAWQIQDHEAGIMMLTDAAREHVTPEKLQEFFSPGPDAAFEIQRGKRVNGGEYVFPVVLFATSEAGARPRLCSIVITRAGKDEWLVQKLP